MMTRRITLRLFAVASLVASIGFAIEQDDVVESTTAVSTPEHAGTGGIDGAGDAKFRLREGMKFVNRIGELRDTGGRITFYPDGQSQSLQLLENLALERVTNDLDQTHRKWSVTGTVTEFKGSNYLLLHRAVLKARSTKASGPRS